MSGDNLISKGARVLKREGAAVFGKKAAKFARKKGRAAASKITAGLPKGAQVAPPPNEDYNYLANPLFDISDEILKASKKVHQAGPLKEVKTATFIVPYFQHLAYGGNYMIFRLIDALARRGVKPQLYVFDNPDMDREAFMREVAQQFPALKNATLLALDPNKDNISELPPSDIAVCTTWQSAYVLLRYNQTKRKYYLIQDYEPLFWPAGSMYGLAQSTYRFGFYGIATAPGLLNVVESRHGLKGVAIDPPVDLSIYYPPKEKPAGPIRICFYARPSNFAARNCFELGMLIIKKLKDRFGDQVEIITLGSEWDESVYGLKGKISNVGLLPSQQAVADLYRSCHIGFVYMLTPHPSFQPIEYMATGVATVTNYNEDNLWLLKDGQNCLLAEPSPQDMADKISQLVKDKKLRQKIVDGGWATMKDRDWEDELEKVWRYIQKT